MIRSHFKTRTIEYPFGSTFGVQKLRFAKSWPKNWVLKNALNAHLLLWTSSGPFSKSPWTFWGICWGWVSNYQIALQMLMSSEIAQCLHSTLGHLSALRKLLHSSHHSYSLFHHSPTQAKETQNKHSIPTETTIQQKKNKRRGGAPPYHQPNTTTAIHFQQLIIHHKIDLKSTENPT